MMGSGKTTIGIRLAARLDRPFVDSDAVLRSTTGRDAAHIAAQNGIAALHAAEAELLLDVLHQKGRVVVAAAASVVESEQCRRTLAEHTCVWLDADAATLASRHHRAEHRRELTDAEEELAAQKRERDPWFAELSALRIDTAVTKPDGALAAALEATTRPDPYGP